MKYFTKEWYGLMTFRGYTDGVTPVPDSAVSDEDIARYYREDLEAELSAAKNRGSGADALLAMLGVSNSPVNADPREVRREFEESYKNMLRYGTEHYPEWVKASADRRLLALWRMPKSVYDKLVLEEKAAEEKFEAINRLAEAELSKQDIPGELQKTFCFHDGHVLSLKKQGRDGELVLCPADTDMGPFVKLRFVNLWLFEKESGLVIRPRGKESNCVYLYDELYRNEKGYEFHMLLWTRKALRYATVGCEDIIITQGESF
ncbi:MAG: DUF4085 family protein [Ruminococcaceae bacterium]|nr:DUF4085 family protein [Oscillospiraceae bacterium]